MSDDGYGLSVSHVMTGHVTYASRILTAIEWIHMRMMRILVRDAHSSKTQFPPDPDPARRRRHNIPGPASSPVSGSECRTKPDSLIYSQSVLPVLATGFSDPMGCVLGRQEAGLGRNVRKPTSFE